MSLHLLLSISYKAINARGPSNTLEDQLDFQEFISEYQKVILSGKKMSVIVTIKDNITEKNNKKHKKVSFYTLYEIISNILTFKFFLGF